MSETISNPYFELLGIPEAEQPPDRYRLLGIPKFTSNEHVIRNAAARHMQFLRRVGGDRFADQVQEILNEVAEAKLFLLNAKKRIQYDIELNASNGQISAEPPRETSSTQKPVKTIAYSMGVSEAHFVALSGKRMGQTISIKSSEIEIGFESKCDIQLEREPSAIVSNLIIRNNQGKWVIDSPGNVFVLNSRFVEDRAFLANGDVIRFGPFGPDIQFLTSAPEEILLTNLRQKYKEERRDRKPVESNGFRRTGKATSSSKTQTTKTKTSKQKSASPSANTKTSFQKETEKSTIVPWILFGMFVGFILIALALTVF